MLWIKAFHIIFVTSWFAGLFYLPRLFVNHAMVTDIATLERLSLMEKKLYRFMLPLAILALFFGVWYVKPVIIKSKKAAIDIVLNMALTVF